MPVQSPSTESARKMTPPQRLIFIGCFLIYSCCYIGRLNFAATMTPLMDEMGLTEMQISVIPSLFAIIYALGQLINGIICDHFQPRRYIMIGLSGSALMNIALGFASSYTHVLILWSMNAVFQSMIWTPTVRIMAECFDAPLRQKVSSYIAVTIVVGHFCAWAISGYLAAIVSWRYSFIIPGCILLIATGLAFILFRGVTVQSRKSAHASGTVRPRLGIHKLLFSTGLFWMLLCCIATGFVRDGVMNWAPAFIQNSATGDATISITTITLAIPVINLFGVLLSQYIKKRLHNGINLVISLLMAAGMVVCIVLWRGQPMSVVAISVCLGCCCACMYGANSLETIMYPLQFVEENRTGLVAGLIDAIIYAGSSVGSITAGVLCANGGMSKLFFVWILVLCAGSAAALISQKHFRLYNRGLQNKGDAI